MKSVVAATLKGGVGKTSVLNNVAGIMAEQGKRVLLLDLDAQSNLTLGVGVDVTRIQCKTIVDLFEAEGEIQAEVLITKTKHKNIDIVPASIYLVSTEIKIAPLAGRETILKNWINDNIDYLNTQYDYVLIDTNPSFNIINQNAFFASDSILLVSDVSHNAFEGAQQFIALWKDIRRRLRINDNIKGLIINNYDKRTRLANEYLDYIKRRDDLGKLLVLPAVPSSIKVKESEMEATSLSEYAQESAPYVAYLEICNVLVERGIL